MNRNVTKVLSDTNVYIGQRNTHQASSSPSCGPKEQKDHYYQSKEPDPMVDVLVHPVVRNLAAKTMVYAFWSDILAHNLMDKMNSYIRQNCFAIVTGNFMNTSHIDKMDEYVGEFLEDVRSAQGSPGSGRLHRQSHPEVRPLHGEL